MENIKPKNEVELRLICVNLAMSTSVTNPSNKISETLEGAEKILSFVTDDHKLKIENENIIGELVPLAVELFKENKPKKKIKQDE